MGLDNLWVAPSQNAAPPHFDPPLNLTIGIAPDTYSFRGKVYAEFFRDVLGVDLFQELDNAKVLQVADMLENLLVDKSQMQNAKVEEYECFDLEMQYFKTVSVLSLYGVRVQHIQDLARAFRGFGIAGAKLAPWY